MKNMKYPPGIQIQVSCFVDFLHILKTPTHIMPLKDLKTKMGIAETENSCKEPCFMHQWLHGNGEFEIPTIDFGIICMVPIEDDENRKKERIPATKTRGPRILEMGGVDRGSLPHGQLLKCTNVTFHFPLDLNPA